MCQLWLMVMVHIAGLILATNHKVQLLAEMTVLPTWQRRLKISYTKKELPRVAFLAMTAI